ncbi:MAG TPA: hypothetical protein VK402_09530 [Blastococcus sp.]|nr:hypothetical protein [Blastococcus sp.]
MADQAELDVPPDVLEQLHNTLSIRDAVLDLLLDKVDNDRYPSPTMLDDIERILTPWRRDDYVEVLLAKIRADRFPSHDMIERLLRLCG